MQMGLPGEAICSREGQLYQARECANDCSGRVMDNNIARQPCAAPQRDQRLHTLQIKRLLRNAALRSRGPAGAPAGGARPGVRSRRGRALGPGAPGGSGLGADCGQREGPLRWTRPRAEF